MEFSTEGFTRKRAVPTVAAYNANYAYNASTTSTTTGKLCTTRKVRSLRSATTSTRAHTTQLVVYMQYHPTSGYNKATEELK
eukprot:1741942-Amphidinium_carterae.1